MSRYTQETNTILASIDQEILKSQQAHALLVTNVAGKTVAKHRGRLKRSTNKKVELPVAASAKRAMSPEGKARIVAA